MIRVDKTFTEIVSERLEQLDEKPFAFCARVGFPYEKLRGVLRDDDRRADPKFETAREICAALGLEFYIGEPRPAPPQIEVHDQPTDGIPLYDAQAAAGAGVFNADAEPVDYLGFPRDWLKRQGITAGHCIAISVRGDSMAPSICDGDLVMIDRHRRNIVKKRVYVYNCPTDGLRVKRLEYIDAMKAIAVHSDNPDIDTTFVAGDAADAVIAGILGEVVWTGRVMRYDQPGKKRK